VALTHQLALGASTDGLKINFSLFSRKNPRLSCSLSDSPRTSVFSYRYSYEEYEENDSLGIMSPPLFVIKAGNFVILLSLQLRSTFRH
jgi:hypothetical protein